MSTAALLLFGAATVVLFVVVMSLEGARRPGYDAAYHTGSELELGPGGWIQRANFLLVGSGFAAVAVGVQRTLQTTAGAVLLGAVALGLVMAAIFAPDSVRGYPPGASSRTARPETLHARAPRGQWSVDDPGPVRRLRRSRPAARRWVGDTSTLRPRSSAWSPPVG